MRFLRNPLQPVAGLLAVVLAASALLVPAVSALASWAAIPAALHEEETTTNGASLHNPSFDNHDWYFFHDRYDPSYPSSPDGMKPLLPDDDNNLYNNVPSNILQDWRLWYMRGTPLIQTFSETSLAHSGEAVGSRTYSGDVHHAGLYQVVYNVTPCLLYNFQMYGRSEPDAGQEPSASLQVGIDQVGWHPNSQTDPAVPGAFPATTVWGASSDYKRTYGALSVTAEARASQLTVFTYAYATGGRRHAILWDTGSFQDVTPATIYNPSNPQAPGGISNLSHSYVSATNATINWTTAGAALGQVFYSLHPTGSTPPDYPNRIYLPLVIGGPSGQWQASTLNKVPTTVHSETLMGLLPGRTYTYVAVSRGLSGDQCATWVSEFGTFTTSPY